MNSFRIEKRKIEVDDYQNLRQTTGWNPIDNDKVEKALENDLFSVCVMVNDRTVGIGRVIGDGAIYFYIQDVIVHPNYRGKGTGKLIMDSIEEYLWKEANNNSFIGLMAAEGVKEFYKTYNYSERPSTRPGMFKIIKT